MQTSNFDHLVLKRKFLTRSIVLEGRKGGGRDIQIGTAMAFEWRSNLASILARTACWIGHVLNIEWSKQPNIADRLGWFQGQLRLSIGIPGDGMPWYAKASNSMPWHMAWHAMPWHAGKGDHTLVKARSAVSFSGILLF